MVSSDGDHGLIPNSFSLMLSLSQLKEFLATFDETDKESSLKTQIMTQQLQLLMAKQTDMAEGSMQRFLTAVEHLRTVRDKVRVHLQPAVLFRARGNAAVGSATVVSGTASKLKFCEG